jgi:curli biogenesis system outer membrane secretion channel CsgG
MVTLEQRTFIVLVTGATMLGCGGCSKSFAAREYPSFYDPNLHTVAVLPFQNDTGTQGAGTLAADSLAAALRINGTYQVVTPHRLQAVIRQKKLESLSRTDYQRDARELRQLGGIQAFITGRVLPSSAINGLYPPPYGYSPYHPAESISNGRARYELVDGEEEEREGDDEGFDEDFGDGFDDFYGPYYPYWYWNSPYAYGPKYYAEAYVSLEASMVRVSDAAILYQTSVPVQARADLSASRRISPASATFEAMNRATAKLVQDLAVVSTQVTVPSNLKTAVGQVDGQWTFSNRFSPSDQGMYVVIELPASVAHDTFRLTITPRGRPDDVVVAKDFTWPSGRTTDAVSFSPSEIAARAGTGRYTVSLHALGKFVMQHNFTIK